MTSVTNFSSSTTTNLQNRGIVRNTVPVRFSSALSISPLLVSSTFWVSVSSGSLESSVMKIIGEFGLVFPKRFEAGDGSNIVDLDCKPTLFRTI